MKHYTLLHVVQVSVCVCVCVCVCARACVCECVSLTKHCKPGGEQSHLATFMPCLTAPWGLCRELPPAGANLFGWVLFHAALVHGYWGRLDLSQVKLMYRAVPPDCQLLNLMESHFTTEEKTHVYIMFYCSVSNHLKEEDAVRGSGKIPSELFYTFKMWCCTMFLCNISI